MNFGYEAMIQYTHRFQISIAQFQHKFAATTFSTLFIRQALQASEDITGLSAAMRGLVCLACSRISCMMR
jgi:hypothetical protein